MSLTRIARQWFRISLNDLKTATALAPMGKAYRAGAAFFSQQSVEKSIKGYLAFHKIRFPKTHKIHELLTVLHAIDGELAKKLKKAERLSKYAVSLRYPDAEKGQLTDKKVKSAVKVATETYSLITAAVQEKKHHEDKKNNN